MSKIAIERVKGTIRTGVEDTVAIEEPMEIRLAFTVGGERVTRSLSITMRTPGDDLDLAAGFLFTEGIVSSPHQIQSIAHWSPPVGETMVRNVVRVDLTPDIEFDFQTVERHFYTTSSCGICGRASLEALNVGRGRSPLGDEFSLPAAIVHQLPERLREAQSVFDQTGGLHAAALFDANGTLLNLCEDVGRHNAVDKLIGAAFQSGQTTLSDRILFLSGRSSFELVQKAVVAGIPVVAAVGAPSSLAVELARESNMTLLGFVRDDRFNIYSGGHRVVQ